MKTVAIVQSNYIPWKGYFDLINLADEFILLDQVQYTVRDWRNRNRIKTPQGPAWLTIPVEVKGKRHQAINEVKISNPDWNVDHWKSIAHNYSRAKHFQYYRHLLEELYAGATDRSLSQVNFRFISAICRALGIQTRLSWSMDYQAHGIKTERLVHLCLDAGATEYLTGPAARAYLDQSLFASAGISVTYIDYAGYSEYDQLYPPFDHHVSIIDLLVSTGPEAPRYLRTLASASALGSVRGQVIR
jgi:hypothetical protein